MQTNSGSRPSLLAAVAFHHEGSEELVFDPMSISGKFAEGSILANLEQVDDATLTAGGRKQDGHFELHKWYQKKLGLSGLNNLDDDTASASEGSFHGTGTNFVCYQGLQCERDTDGKWDKWTTNTGHLGDSETIDSSMAWSGHLTFKTSVNYHVKGNTISLSSRST